MFYSLCHGKFTCTDDHSVCPHICYCGLLIWPEPTCHAPSNVGIGYLRNTGAFALRYAPPPPPPSASTHWAWEKVTRITWIKHCDRGPLGLGSHRGSQVSLFTAPSPVSISWGWERRDGPLKAYISVDGEINQIISGVRKRAQREPSWSPPFEM